MTRPTAASVKADLKDRIAGAGRTSSIVGLVLSSAIAGAVKYYETTGNVTSWEPYAGAAAVAVVGALWKQKPR